MAFLRGGVQTVKSDSFYNLHQWTNGQTTSLSNAKIIDVQSQAQDNRRTADATSLLFALPSVSRDRSKVRNLIIPKQTYYSNQF
jgi:hypothetical protein